MAEKRTRSRPARRFSGGGADYVALGLIALAAVSLAALALSGFSLRPGINLSPTPRPASTVFDLPAETPTPTPTPEAPIRVSLLTDQPTAAADSWWGSSVAASVVPGVIAGGELAPTEAMESPLTVSELQGRVASAPSLAGYVVVNVGSGDIDGGSAPSAIVTEIQGLWQDVVAKGGTPIVALVAPSNENVTETVEINGLLRTAAAEAGFGVLDLYSPVAAANGSWTPSFSSDGALPNAEGAQALAQAVVSQLPQLVAAK